MSVGENHDLLDEKSRQATVLVALRTGLLKRCPIHNELYDPGQHDFQGACMVATYLVNNGDPLVAAFHGDRATLMTQLRSICQLYDKACPQCSKPTST
jgi:hypothetical protein